MTDPDSLAARQAAWFQRRDAHALAAATNHPAGSALRAAFPPADGQPAKDRGLMTPAQYERTAAEFRSLADVCTAHAARLDAAADLTAYAFQSDRAAQLATAFRQTADVASRLCREAMEMAETVRSYEDGPA